MFSFLPPLFFSWSHYIAAQAGFVSSILLSAAVASICYLPCSAVLLKHSTKGYSLPLDSSASSASFSFVNVMGTVMCLSSHCLSCSSTVGRHSSAFRHFGDHLAHRNERLSRLQSFRTGYSQ